MNKPAISLMLLAGCAAVLLSCDDGDSVYSGGEIETGEIETGEQAVEDSLEQVEVENGGEPLKSGSMVDPRDGKTYRTVLVASQLWMAENLDFYDTLWGVNGAAESSDDVLAPTSESFLSGSDRAYDVSAKGSRDSGQSDEAPGASYTYDEAMDFTVFSDTAFNGGICPPGWHLPTMGEFDALREYVTSGCDSTCSSLGIDALSRAESYWAASETVFAGKPDLRFVRCLQGANTDSVADYAAYIDRVEEWAAAKHRADSVNEFILNGAKNYFNKDLEYGYFTDERDGNVYGYIKIGNHTWMAENLRFRPVGWYLCDTYVNCSRNDSIYYYKAGIDYYVEQKDSACPAGWHLPSDEEWTDLRAASPNAGDFLAVDGLWVDEVNPTNSTGFSAVTTSQDRYGGQYSLRSNRAGFWLSDSYTGVIVKIDTTYTHDSLDVADSVVFDTTKEVLHYDFAYDYEISDGDFVQTRVYDYNRRFYTKSIRCVKDE